MTINIMFNKDCNIGLIDIPMIVGFIFLPSFPGFLSLGIITTYISYL